MQSKYLYFAALIGVSTLLGYIARRQGVKERLAEVLMTIVSVGGYSVVGLLSVWVTPLSGVDIWLPVLGAIHVAAMTFAGIAVARLATKDRGETGVFAVTASIGNTGFTMGGFVCWILFKEDGLGKSNLYGLMWSFLLVGLTYPVARHFAEPDGQRKSLPRLLWQSIFDYRSIGLPMIIIGMLLSKLGVPRPEWIKQSHLMDILIYSTTALAYFSIGLRLHFSSVWPLRKLAALHSAVRFPMALAAALGLTALVGLTAWPMDTTGRNVFLICSFCPTAVSAVAVCNMFNLRPREASTFFVLSTAGYVAIILPIVVAVFGGKQP